MSRKVTKSSKNPQLVHPLHLLPQGDLEPCNIGIKAIHFLQIQSKTKGNWPVENYDSADTDTDADLDDWDSTFCRSIIDGAGGCGDDDDEESKDKKEPIKYEFLIRLFVNLGYYICLVPFRFEYVEVGQRKFFEIKSNWIQKVICMLQSGSATIVCFVVAYGHIGGKNIENNPLIIFNFWSYAVFCWWCFLFVHIFFTKQHLILAIVNREQQLNSQGLGGSWGNFEWNKWETWFATVYFFGVIIEEIYHKCVFYLFPKTYNLKTAVEVYSGKALYTLFMKSNEKPFPYANLTDFTFSISVWHFVGWQQFGAIKSMVYIFITFNSLFLLGKVGKSFGRLRSKTSRQLQFSEIWAEFAEIRSSIERINELSNLPILGIYLILVPFLSSAIIQRWDSDFIEYKVLMILQFVWPMIALVLASEASRMGEKFLKTVKDTTETLSALAVSGANGCSMTLSSAHYVFENASLSLRGGKFFRLSYGFLGTTLSVVMTYGMVILGFLHEEYKQKAGIGGRCKK